MNIPQISEQSVQISVVIPTRDRLSALKTCLVALCQQEFPVQSYEIIVCDDGSVEDVGGLVSEFSQAGGNWVYLKQPAKGPGAARNLGIRQARGKIVAMTDSDTVPDPKWLTKIWEALLNHPEAIAVEGRVYAQNEGEFGPLGEGPTNKVGGVYLTCNCAYRRHVLLKAGGFDETFPYAAYEDTELAARVQQFGSIVWQPEAVVIHPERPLTMQGVLKKLRHWEYVLIMGFRYGYLAWRQYPVNHPRLRVALLASLVLPTAKFRKALSWFRVRPIASCVLAFYGLVEAVGAIIWVTPKALFANYASRVIRNNYLGDLNG
ncbi:MAG: glycosyltransferase family 2 protein [Acidobacteria bacterium]|nr:glycosyltransferase family 2 protein [Acidobacteriota bacterium]MBI3428056.1 glycosyltransferase family 2 protein [Acidobacteriota bacterium]